MSHTGTREPTPRDVFDDPIVQLAAICPLCALAALSPEAALAALAPTLRIFNPAINPNAAMLAFAVGLIQSAQAQAHQAARVQQAVPPPRSHIAGRIQSRLASRMLWHLTK